MDVLWDELSFGLLDRRQLIQVIVRMISSVLIASIIGFQREAARKSAGLRTHILVSLGSTIFVIGCIGAGMREDAISRVIQGIITGIGFIGAGTIIKRETNIKGLTTSAGLWATCAIGVIVGLGELGIALIAAVLIFLVLTIVRRIEDRYLENDGEEETTNNQQTTGNSS
ncbi:MAG: MgtC/SapB family protein [Acidobacteria bacterium]|nr:MgtC/SapB family protein [Acidobacteriota bacterium]